MTIAHVTLPVSSLPTSKTFYEAALAPLTYTVYASSSDPNGSYVGFAPRYGGPEFWIRQRPKAGAGEGGEVQRTHVAFLGRSRGQVVRFYEAALKAGALDNGKPGERDYAKGYYAAYVLDPDGNNLECLYYQPLWLSAIQVTPVLLGAVLVGGLSWWAGLRGWSLW